MFLSISEWPLLPVFLFVLFYIILYSFSVCLFWFVVLSWLLLFLLSRMPSSFIGLHMNLFSVCNVRVCVYCVRLCSVCVCVCSMCTIDQFLFTFSLYRILYVRKMTLISHANLGEFRLQHFTFSTFFYNIFVVVFILFFYFYLFFFC